jgi:hypothetical protein
VLLERSLSACPVSSGTGHADFVFVETSCDIISGEQQVIQIPIARKSRRHLAHSRESSTAVGSQTVCQAAGSGEVRRVFGSFVGGFAFSAQGRESSIFPMTL